MRRYLAGLVLVSALAFASAAPAGQPDMTRVDVDETTSPEILCNGFQIDLHETGHFILRTFFDKNGDLQMALNNFALMSEYFNPDTGESLTSPDVGADHLTIKKDGSETVGIIGIVTRFVVPGQGLVAGEVGKVTLFFDEFGELVDVTFAGIHDGFDAIDAAICEALAP